MPLVESKIEGFVGTICLDYFEKRNAFSAACEIRTDSFHLPC